MKNLIAIVPYISGAILGAVAMNAYESGDLESFGEDLRRIAQNSVFEPAQPNERLISEWQDPTPDEFSIDEITGQYKKWISLGQQQDFKITILPNDDMEVWEGPGFGKPARTYVLKYLPNVGGWETEDRSVVTASRSTSFDGTKTVTLTDIGWERIWLTSK